MDLLDHSVFDPKELTYQAVLLGESDLIFHIVLRPEAEYA
jgi:hypothetical protein